MGSARKPPSAQHLRITQGLDTITGTSRIINPIRTVGRDASVEGIFPNVDDRCVDSKCHFGSTIPPSFTYLVRLQDLDHFEWFIFWYSDVTVEERKPYFAPFRPQRFHGDDGWSNGWRQRQGS